MEAVEQTTAKILPRDKLLRDIFTPAENILFGLIVVASNTAFWLADPRTYWLLGFFLIAGAMTLVVLKAHEFYHPFFVTFLWPKFWLCTAPAWFALIQFCVGLMQTPLASVRLEGAEYLQLDDAHNAWLPISTSAQSAWPVVLGFACIHLVAVDLFIVPKSRYFFEKLMPVLCLSAVLVALFGYVQAGFNLDKALLTKGTGAKDFFGFFPYDGHWAAFATLWTSACIGMALLTTRYDDSPPFIESTGPWYLAGATLLGASGFMIDAHWPAVCLMLTYAVMMLVFSLNIFSRSKEPQHISIALVSGIIAAAMLAAGLSRVIHHEESTSATGELRQSAWEMFLDYPIFGWGVDSFGHLLPFYGSDLLLTANYERASSDALQFLAEWGIIGVIPAIILFLCLIGRYIRGRYFTKLTNHFLVGISAVLLLSFVDSPFMSPAVFLSFVMLLFIALRWADVSGSKADEVDAPRPDLVTPESHRRLPFYTGPENNKFM